VSENAYWVGGVPYCAGCVECDTPALGEDEASRAARAPGVGRCGCCKASFDEATRPDGRKEEK